MTDNDRNYPENKAFGQMRPEDPEMFEDVYAGPPLPDEPEETEPELPDGKNEEKSRQGSRPPFSLVYAGPGAMKRRRAFEGVYAGPSAPDPRMFEAVYAGPPAPDPRMFAAAYAAPHLNFPAPSSGGAGDSPLKRCPSCGYLRPIGLAYCPECGEKAPENCPCPNCGSAEPFSARFCSQCGTELTEEAEK